MIPVKHVRLMVCGILVIFLVKGTYTHSTEKTFDISHRLYAELQSVVFRWKCLSPPLLTIQCRYRRNHICLLGIFRILQARRRCDLHRFFARRRECAFKNKSRTWSTSVSCLLNRNQSKVFSRKEPSLPCLNMNKVRKVISHHWLKK